VIVRLKLNGIDARLEAAPDEPLLEALRRRGLRSVRLTCGIGVCGACTVLLDGRPVSSCLMLAPMVDGREVLTAEGLASGDRVALAFQEASAFQCGYCTPAMVLTVRALLEEVPNPSREEVRRALAGNLCRCGSYLKILDAVVLAAR
jgi:aerobic-type carbon monoxide dehydrogenase small subunit (CoxS/CutS family)